MADAGAIEQVGWLMVPVDDQDRAIAFYTERLGMELVRDTSYPGQLGEERWVEVAPPGGKGAALALTLARGEWKAGAMTNAILGSADIDATHAALRAAGVDVDAEVMRAPEPVPPMFWLRDSEGNTLLVVG